MKNAMQLKAIMKAVAKEKRISVQLVLQNYMLERLLERIALSRYRDNFILKGGFLIAAIVGLHTRATMDMDVTAKGVPVNADEVRRMFEEISLIAVDDGIDFVVKRAEEIRELDEYAGIRLTLEAMYPPMAVPLKVDITTGDKITPREIQFQFKLMLEPRSISVLAYNIETVLAEKLETLVSRGDQNTRMRDYYDVYILHKMQWQNVDPAALKAALTATVTKRGSTVVMDRYLSIMQSVADSDVMQQRWGVYKQEFEYAKDIELRDACLSAMEILESTLK